jgi:hypothetical protein
VNGQLNLGVRPRRLSQDRPSSRTTAETTGPPNGSWDGARWVRRQFALGYSKADIIASSKYPPEHKVTVNHQSCGLTFGPGFPDEYRTTIRKGDISVADGTLGTRWSGLVECIKHFRYS